MLKKKKKRPRVQNRRLNTKKNPGGKKREPRGKITLPGKEKTTEHMDKEMLKNAFIA